MPRARASTASAASLKTRGRVATGGAGDRRAGRPSAPRARGTTENTAHFDDDARGDVGDDDDAVPRSRVGARRAFARVVRGTRMGGDGRRRDATGGRETMETAKTLAERAGCETRGVVFAPALWARASGGWTMDETREALRELGGAGAVALATRYARARDVEGCEMVRRACVDMGLVDDAREAGMILAKLLSATPGREGDAERAWSDIAESARGNAAMRAEAHCTKLEGLCLNPSRVKAFVEAYDAFREEFRDAATREWTRRAATPARVQRAYTAACRLINTSHSAKLAKKVTYDLLRDHQIMRRELDGFALATDYCVCALLGAATPSTEHAAMELFEISLESGVDLSATTWSYVVSMYAGMNRVDEAITMLDRLEALPFMQSGTLGALAFAAAFNNKDDSEASIKLKKRAKELQLAEARNAAERSKVERAYAHVMRMLNAQGNFKFALRVFTRMQSSGVRATDSETYVSLYNALSERTPVDDPLGKSVRRSNLHRVLQTIKTHLKDVEALVVALEVASHAGVADVCEDIHDRLRWNGHFKSASVRTRVWQHMMTVRCNERDRLGTLQLYEEWSREGDDEIVVGDDFWFYLIKSYCDDTPNVDMAMAFLERAVAATSVTRKATPPRTFNIVIQACVRARRPALALNVLARMRDASVTPTHITYLFVMRAIELTATVEQPSGEDSSANVCRSLIADAREDGIKPTPKMWSSALRACARGGDVDAAKEVFAEMISDGCEPSVHAFNALMAAHVSKGDARSAVETYWTSRREHDVTPDSTTMHTILRAVGAGVPRDVVASAAEAYADMRAFIRPNNDIVALLAESAISDIDIQSGMSAARIFAGDHANDVDRIDLRERSVAEARVVVLELLQRLRDRASASREPIAGDVRVITGRGKVRDEIEKLAADVCLVLAYAENDDATLVITREACSHWLAKP